MNITIDKHNTSQTPNITNQNNNFSNLNIWNYSRSRHNNILAELPNQIEINNLEHQPLCVLAIATRTNNYNYNYNYHINSNMIAHLGDDNPQLFSELTFAINNEYSIELDLVADVLIIRHSNPQKYIKCSNILQLSFTHSSIDLITKLYEINTMHFDNYVKGRFKLSQDLSDIIVSKIRILDGII